ncbi:Gamma tubulin complex component [Gracilaria domingensis]|nr:Gamma tubulin complex component [Gracilaria domingensis]
MSSNDGFLPISQIWNVLHTVLLDLSADSQPYVMLKHVWNDVITILRGQLFLLLVHARISDPRNEFFISPSSVVTGNLPSFISVEAAENIYAAYKATKCTISMSEEDVPCSIYPTDEFKHMLSDPMRAQLQIESAAMRWRRRASQNISQVFPFVKVRDRIRSLRKYLLHGDSSFWRFFFGLLRNASLPSVTSPESRSKSEKILNRILQTTVTEYGVACPLFELQVRENGEVIPTFTLSFVESQVLASRAHVYCDLFSVTFSIRQAACDLQASFMELQAHRKRMIAQDQLRKGMLFVKLFELRRRMACFIDGYEWYIQAQVLQPGVDDLLRCVARGEEGIPSKRKPLFDAVVEQHEETMERLLKQCFVGERVIMARMQAIASACLSLGELIRGLPRESFEVTDVELSKDARAAETLEAVDGIEKDFKRNYELLVRMLCGAEKRGSGSKVSVLLQQIVPDRE